MRMRRVCLTLVGLVFLVSGVLGVGSAAAVVRIKYFNVTPSTTQAGAHPNLEISFANTNRISAPTEGGKCGCNDIRDALVSFPPGFIGNVHATPQCTAADLARESCPSDSQVGIITVKAEDESGYTFFHEIPVYNTVPKPRQPGLLAWLVPILNLPVYTILSARTGGDYGLDALTSGITQAFPLGVYEEELWGVPADPSHDSVRTVTGRFEKGASSDSPLTPFLQNPTRCAGPLSSSLTIFAYDETQSNAESVWPASTGCDLLSFDPSLSAQPTTSATDTPSGLEVDLKVPQTLSPTTPSQSEIRGSTVILPEGFTINPNAADGKRACLDAEAHFGATEAASCPEFAKIGTVSITSAALPGPVPGSIYIGEPTTEHRYRIFLVADGFATHIKLAGTITPDPRTGQLTTTFENLPQSPLTEIDLHFFGAERGLLATPIRCGTYAVHSFFTPWDESLAEQESTQFFTVTTGPGGSATECPSTARPFAPHLAASSTSNAAGSHAPFWLDLTRADGEQDLSTLNVTTPPGLLATLSGISYCSDTALAVAASPSYSGLAEQQTPSCPMASLIGTAITGAGAGPRPIYVSGKVYLAGPYNGAPLSLAVITPAVSGPYDLGNVVLRAALHINPETAQVTAASDPLPQILEGIPLRLRSVLVDLDRPGFTLNPTNCEALSVSASISGTEGALATPAVPFQVANCSVLPFAPRLSLGLSGSTKQAGNPALTATLIAKPGEANISRTQVTLPRTELIDNAHINEPCTRVQFKEGKTPGEKCPSGSILGFAKADTPLLEKPLEGPIYLRTTGRAGLPDVVAALNGQIDIALDGHVDSVHGGLRTTFETVPDAPVTKVVLSFDGGHRGLIENSPQLCAHAQHFIAAIAGQNGRTANQTPILKTPCGKKHKRKARTQNKRRPNRAGVVR